MRDFFIKLYHVKTEKIDDKRGGKREKILKSRIHLILLMAFIRYEDTKTLLYCLKSLCQDFRIGILLHYYILYLLA